MFRRRLKVAIVGSWGIPARYGGYETHVQQIAENLKDDRLEIFVSCEGKWRGIREYANAKLVYFPIISKKARLVSEPLHDCLAILWACFAGVDVIYLLGYTVSPFCIIPRLLGRKVMIAMDGREWKRRKFPLLVRRVLHFSERIATYVANYAVNDSRAIMQELKEEYPQMRGVYVPNAAPKVQEFGASEGYYLVVARFEPENNIDMILRGFMRSHSRKKLIVISNLPRTRYVIETMGMGMQDPRISFIGYVDASMLLSVFRKHAFAYIHGHSVGGTNPSLLESLASANPVLCFDSPYGREVCGKAASYFKDEEELASLIDCYDSLFSFAIHDLRLESWQRAQLYSLDRMIARYTELFSRLTVPREIERNESEECRESPRTLLAR